MCIRDRFYDYLLPYYKEGLDAVIVQDMGVFKMIRELSLIHIYQQYESVKFTPARLEDLSKEEILARIKEGGVVGLGGAGFPTQVKLCLLYTSRCV